MHDFHHNMIVKRVISSTRVTDNTAQTGQIIDRQGYQTLEFIINTGTLADADATFTVLLEHGDTANLSDAAAVSDAELIGTEAEASIQFNDDNEVRKIGYAGGKRYIRLTLTPATNTGNADIGAVAILTNAAVSPVTQPGA